LSEETIILMLGASTLLGATGLIAFIWGLKTKQFDDSDKMMSAVLFDNEEDLNRLAKQQKKKEEAEQQKTKDV
jgi:cbb3-type cytochrome oxidase maturation protein